MAPRERLLSNIILIFSLIGCGQLPKQKDIIYVNARTTELKNNNGIFYLGEQLFTGTIFTLFPNSKDTLQLMHFNLGKEHGIWRSYFAPHVLKDEREYNNGIKTGVLKSWWPNGNIKLQYSFKDGEYEGTCYEWNESGAPLKIAHYSAGHENGEQKVFYDNGKIKSNYIIKDNRRYGLLGTKNCVNVSDSIFNK